MPLSEKRVHNARPENKPYKLFDGGGLFLMISSLAENENALQVVRYHKDSPIVLSPPGHQLKDPES